MSKKKKNITQNGPVTLPSYNPRPSPDSGQAYKDIIHVLEEAKGSDLTEGDYKLLNDALDTVPDRIVQVMVYHESRISMGEAQKHLKDLQTRTKKLLKAVDKSPSSLWTAILRRWPDKTQDGELEKRDFEHIFGIRDIEDIKEPLESLYDMERDFLKYTRILKQMETALDKTIKEAKFPPPSKQNEDKNSLGLKQAVFDLFDPFIQITGCSLQPEERKSYDKTPRGHFIRFVQTFLKNDFPEDDFPAFHKDATQYKIKNYLDNYLI